MEASCHVFPKRLAHAEADGAATTTFTAQLRRTLHAEGPMTELCFPDGFLWGAATAAHQVEGSNTNSDWWQWEEAVDSPCRDPSGSGCEHYTRYRDDVALLAAVGLNTYRFSVEWARIEPAEGTFADAELDHYRAMVESVLEAGLTPMVTLNHFTLPQWLALRGGWRAASAPSLFARYCDLVVGALGDRVHWYCTINEPGVVALGGYLGAFGFPPGTRSVRSLEQATVGLIEGHRMARAVVKDRRPEAKVGSTHSMAEWEADTGGRPLMEYLRRISEDAFLAACADDDFIGVQAYTRIQVSLPTLVGRLLPMALRIGPLVRIAVPVFVGRQAARPNAGVASGARTTQMGYEFRPEAVAAAIERVSALYPGKEIVVTEHGVATDDDEERVEFIDRGLRSIHALIAKGLPVAGYIHWSALDNFEWARGYAPKFGLIGVDRATQERTVRASARHLGQVTRTGCVTVADETPDGRAR